MTNEERREDFVEGLRRMADFFAAHPEVQLPYGVCANVYMHGENQKERLADFAKAAGKVEKHAAGETFWLTKKFSTYVSIDMNATRDEVCERIQTGTRQVEAKPEQVIPAVEAHEEPVYEWVCGSVMQPDEPVAQ